MDQRATGLILRTRPLTESSLIVHWITLEQGRLATVAKGARRPKSPFAGKLDLFFEAEFSFVRSRRSELHLLREVSLRRTYSALRQEIAYLQQAAYCVALIEQATETEAPLPEIYQLLRELLAIFPNQRPQPIAILAFEIKFLAQLGLNPNRTKNKPDLIQVMESLATAEWREILGCNFAPDQIAALNHFLRQFIQFHLGKIPQSREKALHP